MFVLEKFGEQREKGLEGGGFHCRRGVMANDVADETLGNAKDYLSEQAAGFSVMSISKSDQLASTDDAHRLAAKNVDTDPFFVVGIGASAGGLEALEQFFENVPDDSRLAVERSRRVRMEQDHEVPLHVRAA